MEILKQEILDNNYGRQQDHAAELNFELNQFILSSLVTYNIGIYICIYIYKVSYIHSFLVIFNCMFFWIAC